MTLIATGEVFNNGVLSAGGALTVRADSFVNERQTVVVNGPDGLLGSGGGTRAVRQLLAVPVVSAESISITTDRDLINYGGVISANESVRLQSLAGNVTNEAAAWDFTTVFTRTSFWGSSRSTVSVGTAYEAGRVLSDGTVEIYAGQGTI